MINTIVSIIITYLATSIDEIPILYLLYRRVLTKGEGRTITVTYLVGSLLLVILSIFGAIGLVQIPVPWMIGMVGLLPLGMGIKTLLFGEEDDDETKYNGKHKTLWLQVLIMTIAFGMDDLGIYIPLFTTYNLMGYIVVLVVVIIGALLLCLLSYRLTTIEQLSGFIHRRERLIEGTAFIVIGIYVMIERGTFARIIEFFLR